MHGLIDGTWSMLIFDRLSCFFCDMLTFVLPFIVTNNFKKLPYDKFTSFCQFKKILPRRYNLSLILWQLLQDKNLGNFHVLSHLEVCLPIHVVHLNVMMKLSSKCSKYPTSKMFVSDSWLHFVWKSPFHG